MKDLKQLPRTTDLFTRILGIEVSKRMSTRASTIQIPTKKTFTETSKPISSRKEVVVADRTPLEVYSRILLSLRTIEMMKFLKEKCMNSLSLNKAMRLIARETLEMIVREELVVVLEFKRSERLLLSMVLIV